MSIPHCMMRSRHGSVWYARVHIPRHLRPLLNGKREVRRSTGTTEKHQASRLAVQFWAECQTFFDALERAMAKKDEGPSTRRTSRKSQSLKIGYVAFVDALGARHEIDFGGARSEAQAVLEMQEAARIREASLQTLEIYKQSPELLEKLIAKNNAQNQNHRKTTPDTENPMTWDELFSKYEAKEKKRASDPAERYSEKTFNEYAPHREIWRNHFEGRMVDSIKKHEINEIESWLRNFPTNITKKKITLADAIDIAKSEDHELRTLSGASFNHYQRQIAGILDYAYKIGAHHTNLSDCIKQINAKLAILFIKEPFTNEDLSLIFEPTSYLKRLGKDNDRSPLIAKFWIPLILAYSGARLEEICQLKVSDVLYDNDSECHYFKIAGKDEKAPDGESKRTKNENSVKPIPIHSKLIQIGFMEYVESLENLNKDSSLFGLARGSDGKFGAPLSKWFTNKGESSKGFLERCGVTSHGKNDADVMWSKSLHSFRHTVIDNLRDKRKILPDGSRIIEEDIALIVGHIDDEKHGLTTRRYGKGASNTHHRRDIVELIDFQEIQVEEGAWKKISY